MLEGVFAGPAGTQIESLIRSGTKYRDLESIKSVFLHAALKEPQIWTCTQASIMQAMLLAADLDVAVNGHNNGAYFETRLMTCRADGREWTERRLFLKFGYNALIDLATRDGRVVTIDTGTVRACDKFVCELGTSPFIRHTPDFAGGDVSPLAFYAVAVFPGGHRKIELMSAAEAAHIHETYAEKSPAWRANFAEMGRKTVTRRIIKYLPTSPKLAAALEEFDGDYVAQPRTQAANHADDLNRRVMGGSRASEEKREEARAESPEQEARPVVRPIASGATKQARTELLLDERGQIIIDHDDIPF